MHRRQKRQVVITGILTVIALINILFFFILLRPARSDYFNLQSSIEKLRTEIKGSQQQVTRLEKISEQLERFQQDREGLFRDHFIKFDPGFAELSPRLEQMAVGSGVLRPVVDFTRDEVKQYGLYSVKIKIPVTGTYSNAVNFIKNLETSETFFLIDSIGVRSTSEAAPTPTVTTGAARPIASTSTANAPDSVGLALALETFFYK